MQSIRASSARGPGPRRRGLLSHRRSCEGLASGQRYRRTFYEKTRKQQSSLDRFVTSPPQHLREERPPCSTRTIRLRLPRKRAYTPRRILESRRPVLRACPRLTSPQRTSRLRPTRLDL